MEINLAITDGRSPAETKRKLKSELLFSELFEEYLESHSKPKKKTWTEDLEKFKNYIEKPLGERKLSEIDRAAISLIHSNITKAGLWENNPAIGIRGNKEKSETGLFRVMSFQDSFRHSQKNQMKQLEIMF